MQNMLQEHRKQQNQQKLSLLGVFRIFSDCFIALTSLIGTFVLLFIMLVRAMHQEEWRDKIRGFNKQRINPLVLRIAETVRVALLLSSM